MFVVNKNINHNGKSYAKDSEIKESDAGFKELLKSGHVNEGIGKPISAQAEVAVDVVVESEYEESIFKKDKKRK